MGKWQPIPAKTQSFTAKIHRQHKSLVCVLPKMLAKMQNISAGDTVLFEIKDGEKCSKMRLLLKGISYGVPGRGNRDRKDKCR